MSSQPIHMKVNFGERHYILSRFPDSFGDLLAQVADKVKTPLSRDTICYFTDKEGDRIVVAEDADLTNVLEVCRLEGKNICKLAVELPGAGKLRNTSQSASTHHNCFDAAKYLDFLKKNLPSVQEDFARCFGQGMPCEECLGVGKTKDMAKCENCYGRGIRPVTKQMRIIMHYIDLRFQQLIQAPLEAFVASDSHETMDRVMARDSHSSYEDNFSKADTKKPSKFEHPGGGFFAREPPPSEVGTNPPRKMSHRDDFNKVPNDD